MLMFASVNIIWFRNMCVGTYDYECRYLGVSEHRGVRCRAEGCRYIGVSEHRGVRCRAEGVPEAPPYAITNTLFLTTIGDPCTDDFTVCLLIFLC